ncbi:hypothetical protein N866_04085 [Actinotalea ferrariae CF5-4]|uniref:Uncharacterized protein n=1 Tax=Actinotalea ferrariae CF5-4 TaxID=948458 RepID=A0A021VSD9_9CELL|nr:hypothetical protein N866_04085 [Actinotalea ferrariae CF5-4]
MRLRFGHGKRAVSWAMLGQVSALVASTANFLLLARILGPAEYGLVAGTWALVLASAPIAAVGADRLIVRDVSGGHVPPNHALGTALVTMTFGWFVVVGGLAVLQPIILPQTLLSLLLLLAIADVVATGTTTLVNALCFATANAKAGGISAALVNLAKLAAVLLFALTGGGQDPVRWAAIYAGLAVVSATGQLLWAARRYGRPSVHGYHLVTRVREGLPFTGSVVAGVVQNDADKTLLVRAGLAEPAGHYSVAYRMASIAYLPVLAVLQTTFYRFFAAGAEGGLPATAALGRRLAKPLLAYGVLASVGLVVCAPLVPVLVGEQYRPSVPLLMLLAPLVLVKVVQSLTGDVLTGAGFQHVRTRCVAIAAGVNVATNLVLIPVLGLYGAIIATAVAEVLQATLLLWAVRSRLRRGTAPAEDGADVAPASSIDEPE